jgi:hypothetical protein
VKSVRVLVGVASALLLSRVGLCADQNVVFQIAVANLSPSSSADADWGWWTPSKYDEWIADDGADFGLADARLLVSGKAYTAILDGEWYPTLQAVGSADLGPDEDELVQDLSLENSVYDLGIGRRLGGDDRTGVMPWIGVTFMQLRERRTTVPPPGSSDPETTDRAASNLWGVVVGADASYQVWKSLDVTGRVLIRWASGTRTAQVTPEDPGGGASSGTAEVSDSIDIGMWGVDLGLRWNASQAFWMEIGWRYRDETYDGGPATYGGPQIMAAYRFRR